MSVWSIIPSSDVLIEDIGDTLNANGGSVTVNQPHTYFTEEANINKWAKYKPLIYPSPETPSDDERMYRSYGITDVIYFNAMSALDNWLRNSTGSEDWTYTLPKGGEEEPLRLGDFCGYYPEATACVGRLLASSYELNANNQLTISFSSSAGSDYNVNLYDMGIFDETYGYGDMYFKDMYQGILFYNGTTSYYYFPGEKFDYTGIYDTRTAYTIASATNLVASSVKVVLFASSTTLQGIGTLYAVSGGTGSFAPVIPSLSTCRISSYTPPTTTSMKLEFTSVSASGARITLTLRATNTGTNAITSITVVVAAYDSSGGSAPSTTLTYSGTLAADAYYEWSNQRISNYSGTTYVQAVATYNTSYTTTATYNL